MSANKTLRVCLKGHRYYKSSDCPVCPQCEKEKPKNVFAALGAPARRALENAGITTLKKLSQKTEKEIVALHGIGKSSIPKLKKALEEQGMKWKP